MLSYVASEIIPIFPALLLWSFLFFGHTTLRRSMVLYGIIMGAITPIFLGVFTLKALIFFGTDPLFFVCSLSSILVTLFFFSGIVCVFYEEILKRSTNKKKTYVSHARAITATIIIIQTLFFFAMMFYFSFSMWISLLLVLPISFGVFYLLRDTLDDTVIYGSLLFGLLHALMLLVQLSLFPSQIMQFWFFEHMPTFSIFSIPLEELLWAGCIGFLSGPLYELVVKRSRKQVS